MRKSSVGFFLAVALAVNGPALAAGSYTGTMAEVWAGDANVPNKGWIALAGNMLTPACASSNWFIMDLTDPIAKFHFSAALAALAAGKSVRLYGAGTCDGSYERLRAVAVQQ